MGELVNRTVKHDTKKRQRGEEWTRMEKDPAISFNASPIYYFSTDAGFIRVYKALSGLIRVHQGSSGFLYSFKQSCEALRRRLTPQMRGMGSGLPTSSVAGARIIGPTHIRLAGFNKAKQALTDFNKVIFFRTFQTRTACIFVRIPG